MSDQTSWEIDQLLARYDHLVDNGVDGRSSPPSSPRERSRRSGGVSVRTRPDQRAGPLITRLRNNNDGAVPLVARYDSSSAPPGPHCRACSSAASGWKRDVMTYRMVCKLLNDTINRSGITDHAGAPLRFTPHDFRRNFTTEPSEAAFPSISPPACSDTPP